MAGITLEKGKAIYTYGQPMTALHLITSGKVRVDYPGGSYQLGKGGVIGICEICSEVHLLSYTTLENTTLFTYPLSSVNVLNDLLHRNADVARFFLLSACGQINILLNRCSVSEITCNDLYHGLVDDYEKYSSLCERYRITPRQLDGMKEVTAYLETEAEEPWLNDFYLGLTHIYSGEHFKDFIQESSVSLGVLQRGSMDFQQAWTQLDEQFRYQQQISALYFDETGNDLFDCYASLYYKLDPNDEDASALLGDIRRMAEQFKGKMAISDEQLASRMQQFDNKPSQTESKLEDNSTLPTELVGSLNTILEFAGNNLEVSDAFRKHVAAYKMLSDKISMEDSACALRRSLTNEFYVLYTAIFEQTLHTEDIPLAVWMFLYFGYVDEELAGTDNAITLYNIASNITDTGSLGLYTFYHWLMAIFEGKKEPSRNEFDQDYTDFIHKQKLNGNITEKDLMTLESNSMAKVNYELQNMFPSVNKITYGRITTFCPLFTAQSALKNLDSTYVTASKAAKVLEQIRSVDYSAFYRPGLDMEHMDVMGKIEIHTECPPDIILLPNAGIRGALWQEIEGKKRNTPGRMCLSIFHMEDLTNSILRMTGEFRWELCKRIQGSRWNDISESSLTSEYFDYAQFYKKNHDLSADAKERVRIALIQAKNSFKEMFVRDYIQWILYEGNGSPRLNKVARKIFFTYCPFSADICAKLDSNPLYAEILSRHRLRSAQKRHQLEMLAQKLRNSRTPIPDTLEQELEYFNM